MKIKDVSRFCSFVKNKINNVGTQSSLFNASNDKVVEEDEMDVSMLNPSAPMDNLGNSDSFATGDFRFPCVIGSVQRRNGTSKKKKKLKKKKTHS